MKKSGNTFDFNEAIERALATWYPKSHELHFNPHHPLGKLLGEWGELLDDYMKSLYKPGYVFEPENELGDIWYYVRILAYQTQHNPELRNYFFEKGFDYTIIYTMNKVSESWINYNYNLGLGYIEYAIEYSYTALIEIAKRYNLTLDDLTRSNWEKLKPGSERGDQWMKARVETDYTRGKIGFK